MVDLAMSIFEFITKFLVFWHPWHPWVCIHSDLNPLFETDMSDSSYCAIVTILCLFISLNSMEVVCTAKVCFKRNLRNIFVNYQGLNLELFWSHSDPLRLESTCSMRLVRIHLLYHPICKVICPKYYSNLNDFCTFFIRQYWNPTFDGVLHILMDKKRQNYRLCTLNSWK